MPLSKEFYLDEIRSKYPNSYNESLKDLPVKDLEDMLDFLDEALEKADGGSIGIEVLFRPKRDEFSIGGNVQRTTTPQPYDPRASVADYAAALQKVGGGTDLQKAMDIDRYGQSVQRQNLESNINALKAAASVPYNFAKGIIGNFNNPQDLTQVSLTQAQKARLNEIAKSKGTPTGNISYADYGSPTETFSGIFPKTMSPLDASLALTMGGTNFRTNPEGEIEFLGGKYDFNKGSNPVYNFIDKGGIAGAAYGLGEKTFDLVQGAKDLFKSSSAQAAIPMDKKEDVSTKPITSADYPEGYTGPMLSTTRPTMADVAGPAKTFTPDSEGYAAYEGIVPGFTARKRSDGRFEYKAPDGQVYGPDTYMSIAAGAYPNIYDPNKQTLADGGRVGLFMGGPPLEGTALSIYNSMSAYGFSDQEIADALAERGLYTPGGTTEETEIIASAPNIINQQTGGDGPPGPAPTGTKTYGKTFTGMTMPDGTPIGSSGVVEGPGIIDGLKNAATGLFDLYFD